jgi:hypothetical protein
MTTKNPPTAKTPNPSPPKSGGDGHLSAEVRADLGKLLPEQRAEILRVADTIMVTRRYLFLLASK